MIFSRLLFACLLISLVIGVNGCNDDVEPLTIPIEGIMISSTGDGNFLYADKSGVRPYNAIDDPEEVHFFRISSDRKILGYARQITSDGLFSIDGYNMSNGEGGTYVCCLFHGCSGFAFAPEMDATYYTVGNSLEKKRHDHYANTGLEVFLGRRVYHPDVSPDGSVIMFTMLYGQIDSITLFDLSTESVSHIAALPLTETTAPRWSPDGTQVTFADDTHVYIMENDGAGLEKIAKGRFPVWSPDGRMVAYYRQDPNAEDTPGIYVLDLQTRQEELLYQQGGCRFLDWR